jgi:hypothetical protein
MNHHRSTRILPLAVTALAGVALAVPAVPATATVGPLFALEIFAPEPGDATPLCRNTNRGVQPAPSAELPAGTVSVAVIQGSLRRGAATTNACRFRVRTGAGSIVVYKSAATRIDKVRLLDSGVRVVAERDDATGVFVAERVVGRATARNEVERAFLATVEIVQQDLGEWTVAEIGGTDRQFLFDVTNAEIESAASPVAIEFDTVAPPPEAVAGP